MRPPCFPTNSNNKSEMLCFPPQTEETNDEDKEDGEVGNIVMFLLKFPWKIQLKKGKHGL